MTVSREPVLFLGSRIIEDGRNLFLPEAASSFRDTRSLTSTHHCLVMCCSLMMHYEKNQEGKNISRLS